MSIPDGERKIVKAGITIGDVNGIGIEIILKTFSDPAVLQMCTPIIYGSSKVLSYHRKALGMHDFNYTTVRHHHEMKQNKVNLCNCWEEDVKIELGKPSTAAGKYAFKSLESACKSLAEKKTDVMITAPVDKKTIQQEGFNFPGHTEYLGKFFKSAHPLMMMVNDTFRISMITGHLPLKKVAAEITSEKIIAGLHNMNNSLRSDFGIRKPRIAVLALNPHAGDNRLLGDEEEEIIKPAVKKAFDEGIAAFGPYPADGFFGSGSFKKFDGILSMYHDQGLIPFKALSDTSGANFTAGLPVIRTSPAHGVGYDIAGKNIASENSFREAVYVACDVFHKRAEYIKINENPLPFSKLAADR